jgi:hypothetical protein
LPIRVRWAFAAAALLAASHFERSHAAGSAAIQGVAKYVGAVPTTESLKLSADPYCVEANAKNPIVKQDIVVNPDLMLKNVIVHISGGLPASASYPIPADAAVLDQRGCRYEPHVLAMRVGQELKILNSDKTIHNIHAMPKTNERFNFSMISDKVKPQVRKFDKPELPVQMKCDVHPWMQAWVGVFEHPYFSVTGDDGSFEIGNLPPGTYKVSAWHEKLGTQEATVTVGDKDTKSAEFTFRGAGR